jgi:hypothetical protein
MKDLKLRKGEEKREGEKEIAIIRGKSNSR